MSRKALEDQDYEIIKAHVLEPDNSPLPYDLQNKFDRIVSMAKILDKNPILKHAVSIHLSKHPEINQRQAYSDARIAVKIFNSLYTFDFDFWKTWLINDIVRNIERCRNKDSHQDRRVIAIEHANLIKAIGEKPEDLPDPERLEKHQFYLLVNINNQNIKIDFNNLHKLPEDTLRELSKALFAPSEISVTEAEKIMNS